MQHRPGSLNNVNSAFPVMRVRLSQVHFFRPSSKVSLQMAFWGYQQIPRNRRTTPGSTQVHRNPSRPVALEIQQRTKPEDYWDCKAPTASSNRVERFLGAKPLNRKAGVSSVRKQISSQINRRVEVSSGPNRTTHRAAVCSDL